ncbi:MAG: hypothetical protein LBH52_02340 [Puniceicoccales bacterium]|jgi:hypothetical protein|nr:hypothetical protein [Puniceicoccales bacterium]
MLIRYRFLKCLLTLLCLDVVCCTAEAYVSITEDPIGWAKSFGEATQEQRKVIYRQSVEDIARSKTGGMWNTLVNLVTRDKRLTANELLTRLNDNLHIIPNEYREAVSFVTVMKALDTFTDKEIVQNNAQKVETMAKVFGVPLTMAKKLYLKQLIKNNGALTKYPNVVQAADSFITVEKANTLDMPKTYEPTQSVKLINTELIHADKKLPEIAPIPMPEVSIKPESSTDVQSKQSSESKQRPPVEEKKEPKQEQSKEQIPTAKPTDSRQIDRLSSELNSKSALVRELQEKIIELEKQPKEFRPHLIEEGRKSSKENELEAQVKVLRDEISGKDYSRAQLTREQSTEKRDLDARLQATTNQLSQSQRNLGDQQAQNRTLQAEVAQKDHDLGIKDAANNALTDQLNQRDTEITRLNREHATEKGNLETQLTQSQRDLADAQDQNRNLQDQNRDLQNEINRRGQIIAKRDKTIGQLNGGKRILQAENKTLKDEITQLKGQNRDLQLQVTKLFIFSKRNDRTKLLLETVDKILNNHEYLDVMRYQVPPELPASSIRPLPDHLSSIVDLIYQKCSIIYEQGIQVRTPIGEHMIQDYKNLTNFNRAICDVISYNTQIMNELKRSLICMQNMLGMPQGKDVRTFLQETKSSSGRHLTPLQQGSLQNSLEFFVAKIDDYNQLATDIDNRHRFIQELTKCVDDCFDIWPLGKSAEKLGLAMLKNFQLMKFCSVHFQKLIALFIRPIQGQEWSEENVLNALRQAKMKFYALSVLKLAKDVASPSAGWFGTQSPIPLTPLRNMANTLKNLALEDVELTDTEWFAGCQYFTDQCPAKGKIEVSLEKAESLFQKIYKEPLMDEKCFLRMLLSHKLKDLL